MSLSIQLQTILGDEVAKVVLDLVNSKNHMKKYLATEKGKAARKRSNETYQSTHERKVVTFKETEQDILDFLHSYVDAVDHDWVEKHPVLYRTGSEMWKTYQGATQSKITRVRFISLLPKMETSPYILRDGKKVYTPSYGIPLKEYYVPYV